MSIGRAAAAFGCLIVFGGLALLMGRSALGDWREGRTASDNVTMFYAAQQWWPTAIATAGAIGIPFALLAAT